MCCRIIVFCTFSLAVIQPFLSRGHATEVAPFAPTRNDFGEIGLIQMPTGRSALEGGFLLGATVNNDYYHYYTALQITPWLETTLRFTQTPDVSYNDDPNFSGNTIHTDKSIDLKFRLMKESYWLPETAIGFRDLSGTGLFDSEYIAATKRAGPFDFTVGIAWGYIGNSANLIGNKNSSFDCDRESSFQGKGGKIDYFRWFSGCASVFGGIEYQTPWKNLQVKIEYDTNDYKSDFIALHAQRNIPQDSPFNYGVVYKLGDWGNIHSSFERGNTWTFGINFTTDFTGLKQLWRDVPSPPSTDVITQKDASDIDWEEIKEEIETSAGYNRANIYANNQTVTVFSSPSTYRDRSIAHDKTAKILLNSGTSATTYQLIEQQANLSITQTNIDAATYLQVAKQQYIGSTISDATMRINPNVSQNALQDIAQTKRNSPWSLYLEPTLQQSLGGSEGFYFYNIGVSGGVDYWFNNNIVVGGNLYLNLFDNYDNFLYSIPPDKTSLKRVRTLVRQYISNYPIRLNNFQVTAFDQFGENIYAQAYGGYLETMFAGVGGEMLYRRLNSNWAFGLDVNYVAQRNPNKSWQVFADENQFDTTQNVFYQVQTGVTTGHFSIYYRPQWEPIDSFSIKTSVGRYLAEDKGITIDISKQFDSGISAGAFITKTNLSAAEFGEGSFNKGVYLSIPFDIFSVNPSLKRAKLAWSPLSRDGGQMLSRKYHLYDMTNARDPNSEFINKSTWN